MPFPTTYRASNGREKSQRTVTGDTTIAPTDNGGRVVVDSASAVDLTVPALLPVGFNCEIIRAGLGTVTFVESSTDIFSLSANLQIKAQYGKAYLDSYAPDDFILSGDVELDTEAPADTTMAAETDVTDTTIRWNWNAATDNIAVTAYDLQVAEDAGFTTGLRTINLGNVLTYLDTGLTPSTAYYGRVRAKDAAGNAANYSTGSTESTTAPSFDPTDVAGLHIWYDLGALSLSDNDPISSLTDQSGNARHATASGGQRPVFKTGIINSLPVARFDGSAQYLDMPNLSSLTEGEVFMVFKVDTDPPGSDAQSGLWYLGSDNTGTHAPFTDGNIYESFGTTVRKTVGNPTPSLSSTFRIYNVYSKASDWGAELDGVSLFTTATNTVGFPTSGRLGSHGNASYKLDGDIAEFVLFDNKISAPDRADMLTYLQDKYGL